MSSKLDELKKLRNQLDMNIKGIENIPKKGINIFVSNHNCLKDIFYLPMSLNENIASLISARLVYKNVEERKRLVEEYLYALPIEAHGGKIYSDMCLASGVKMVKLGVGISIFPEGAYVNDDAIYKGRTGAARILFDSKTAKLDVNLIPVAIEVDKENIDLDNYEFYNDKVTVKILQPIDFYQDYEKYMMSSDLNEKNIYLHNVIDNSMKSIATSLNKKYIDEYIELYPKGNVIFANGNVVETTLAQNRNYITRYCNELQQRSSDIAKQMIKK